MEPAGGGERGKPLPPDAHRLTHTPHLALPCAQTLEDGGAPSSPARPETALLLSCSQELCLYTLGNLIVESEAVRRQLLPQGIVPALAACIQVRVHLLSSSPGYHPLTSLHVPHLPWLGSASLCLVLRKPYGLGSRVRSRLCLLLVSPPDCARSPWIRLGPASAG